MSDELKPCPFCGSSNISLNEVMSEAPDGTITERSQCLDCKAEGPPIEYYDEVSASMARGVAVWNRRAP